MTEIVEQLADLTALRDRDALDVALCSAIADLLSPQTVAIYRVVGDPGNERCFTSARSDAHHSQPSSDSAWSPLDTLPRWADHPLRQQAITSRKITQASHFPGLTVFPLAGNTGAMGVLELTTEEALPAATLTLVSGVLRLYFNFQSLLDYGERDALTELLNRKSFDGAFLKATVEQAMTHGDEQEGRRDAVSSGTYWLAMIDIDHFKRVNDNFGHLIGDEVLLLLARLMRASFRFHDQLYRFGGEEFVVLMRCNGESQAASALERLRTNTENHLFPQVGHITISTGFSEIKTGDSPSGAFERADKAVYYAKEHGRNQVCSYGALVASGELAGQAVNVGDMELF